MTQVIYARVPDMLKEAADSYAEGHGLTLTAAVVDLVERGLAAVSDEGSVASLQAGLLKATAENAQLRAEVQRTKSELGALEVLRQRSGQTLATCPNPACRHGVTAYQLLAVGRCGECNQGLSDMLTPAVPAAGVDQRELLLLIGTIGALVGIAWLATKGD